MPDGLPSRTTQEMLAREEARAVHARYLDPHFERDVFATFRTGVGTVRCVLCRERDTTNADSVCDACCREVTDDELWHWGGARAVRDQQLTQDDGWAE